MMKSVLTALLVALAVTSPASSQENPEAAKQKRKAVSDRVDRLAGVALQHLHSGKLAEATDSLGEVADLQRPDQEKLDALACAAAAWNRRLVLLDANERYEMLRQWSLPSDTRPHVRALTVITPTDAPPAVFARALGERPRRDSFAVPTIGEVRGLFSTAWELVRAARDSGNLRRLAAEISPLAERQDPQALLVDTLLRIIDSPRQDPKLQAALTQYADDLQTSARLPSGDNDSVIAAACLTHDWLQPVGEAIFKTQIEQSAHRRWHWVRSFFFHAHATAAHRRFGLQQRNSLAGSAFAEWIAAEGSTGPIIGHDAAGPIWLSQQDHIAHVAGHGHDYLLFKYPLTGTFNFTCEVQAGGSEEAEGGLIYGARGYEVSGQERRLILRDVAGREVETLPCPFVAATSHARFNTLSFQATDQGITFEANHHPIWTGKPNQGISPWLGVRARGDRTAVFRNLQLTGNPIVPREVRLLDQDSIDGWLLDGHGQKAWFVRDGVLHGRHVAGSDGVPTENSARYFRPLQENETISYEFQYEPGRFVAHPMLGRLVFLIEPDGVRLHWLTSGGAEWTGLAAGNAVAEPLDRRGPKPLPLEPGRWVRVSATLASDVFTLSLDGMEIYARKMEAESDRTFGFYHDRSRSVARVRNIVLRGDWPEHVAGSHVAGSQVAEVDAVALRRTEPQRKVVAAILNDRYVPGSVLDLCDQAAQMQPLARYDFLSKWVLPNADHESVRTAFAFRPANPAPASKLARRLILGTHDAARTRVAVGGELACPATELVRLAKERSTLANLRQHVEQAPSRTSDDARARAAMLVLIDIARGDFINANRQCDVLENLLHSADLSSFSEHWPETLVIEEGAKHPEIREAASDLASYLLSRWRDNTLRGPEAWVRKIGALAVQLKPLDPAQPLNLSGDLAASLNLKYWSPVSYTTARTRGQGYPPAEWQSSDSQVDHRAGHHEDYLFYRSPLRGDFEIECEVGGFGWRDTELMVAGTWLGPHFDHQTYMVGNFREGRDNVSFEPRLSPTDEWIRWRTVVREGVATIFLNGRRLYEEVLPPDHDPWIAIRSPFFGFGGARDIRITGTPEIPGQIRISGPASLPGWLPYFDETVGDNETGWRYDDALEGGGIVGSRRADLPGSGFESLLRYHRPLLEDGSIEYDFYYSAGASHVHPALDRRTFMLDPTGARIHWVTDGPYDQTRQDPSNLTDEPECRRGPNPLPLNADTWNRLRLELAGDTVRLRLNGQLIYECELEPTNQRTFGLFHYADETEARVRNIVWEGDWPRELPPVGSQELADHRTDLLDRQLPELTAVFEHDFARDGLPLWRFHVYDAGWEENMEVKPDGLHVRRPSGKQSVRFVVSPRMHVIGDFDAIAEYEQLVVAPTVNGKWGISLRSVFDDSERTLSSVFRGLRREPGQHERQIAVGEFTRWKPGGGVETWYPGRVSEEAPSGRLRISRRGEMVSSFVAERDSPNFRHIHTERVTSAQGRYDGIRLRVGSYSAVDEVNAASVVWKRLVVRAEGLANLPVPPPTIKQNTMESQRRPTFGFFVDPAKSGRILSVVQRGNRPARLSEEQLRYVVSVTADRTGPDRHALHALVGESNIAVNVFAVRHHASKLAAEARLQYLSDWVLPGRDHPGFRLTGDFTPTDPPPTDPPPTDPPPTGPPPTQAAEPTAENFGRRGANDDSNARAHAGGELVAPAFDLIDVAKELRVLDELRQRIEKIDCEDKDGQQARAKAALLYLCAIAGDDADAAQAHFERLYDLSQSSDHQLISERWPETLAISRGVHDPATRAILSEFMHLQRDMYVSDKRGWRTSGSLCWDRYFFSLLGTLEDYQTAQSTRDRLIAPPRLQNWAPVSFATSKTRGEGYPHPVWRWTEKQVEKLSGHQFDYLMFRLLGVETASTEDLQANGLRLAAEAKGTGRVSVVWKSIEIRAEQMMLNALQDWGTSFRSDDIKERTGEGPGE